MIQCQSHSLECVFHAVIEGVQDSGEGGPFIDRGRAVAASGKKRDMCFKEASQLPGFHIDLAAQIMRHV